MEGFEQENENFDNSEMILNLPPYLRRKPTIIVTIADSNISPVDLQKMMEAGMSVVRISMSNFTVSEKLQLLSNIYKAASKCCQKFGITEWPIATCLDLKTCVVKTGILEKEVDYINIPEKAMVTLTCNKLFFDKCNEQIIYVDNSTLATDIKIGDEISISMDEIELNCTKIIDKKSIECVVTVGGNLGSMCLVSVRGMKQSRPLLSQKDLDIIKFALQYQVNMIIINYARNANTLKEVKKYIGRKIRRPMILSGISSQEDLDNIEYILKECDGVTLCRDFLPYQLETGKYKMASIQKWVGAKCQQAGKLFYISGGIFEVALSKGVFCTTEISDVTNALYDGATGFFLESYYDIEAVLKTIEMVIEVCKGVENTKSKTNIWRCIDSIKMPMSAAEASLMSCVFAANLSKAHVIVLPTVTGRTAKTLLSMQPTSPIIAVTKNQNVIRELSTYPCVMPIIYTDEENLPSWHQSIEARINFAINWAVEHRLISYGENYVTLQKGSSTSSYCDMVRVWKCIIWKRHTVECAEDVTPKLNI